MKFYVSMEVCVILYLCINVIQYVCTVPSQQQGPERVRRNHSEQGQVAQRLGHNFS